MVVVIGLLDEREVLPAEAPLQLQQVAEYPRSVLDIIKHNVKTAVQGF